MYNNAYVPLPADFRRRSLGDAFGIHATAHMQRMNAMAGDITADITTTTGLTALNALLTQHFSLSVHHERRQRPHLGTKGAAP